jgi:acyl-CoA hydrolase
MPLDVALVQVSPPDAHGFCSFGVSVDVVRSAVDSARHVIAEVNPHMPRTHGDSFVHVSRIDAFRGERSAGDRIPNKPPSPEAMQIGQFIADLIENGATLQTGIGEIPAPSSPRSPTRSTSACTPRCSPRRSCR